jgi:predicted GIY-YIG superfamily endonuclease
VAAKKTYRNPLTERLGAEFFAKLPRTPGVYFMRSQSGEILYVGKATNLRSRVGSYRSARPGKVGRNIIKLLERVASITWELQESEQRAYEREREVIRALVPRYNIADAWEEDYFFIGLRHKRSGELEFRLTSSEEAIDEKFELHGCYPQRRLVKQGYSALLRLLFACTRTPPTRFQFPAKLSRPAPAYRHTMRLAGSLRWKNLISSFLSGQDTRLLPALVEALLSSEVIPEYARPALQRDLETLRDFNVAFLASRRALALEGGQLTTHKNLRQAIRDSLEASP